MNELYPHQSSSFDHAWARSRSYGIDPHVLPSVTPVTGTELQARIMANSRLLESALHYVDHLYRTVESECIVAICDADGILLATRGERLPDELLKQHTTLGMCWSERVFGANAIGTALEENRPLQMVGEDHFLQGLHGMSCAAAPLHDENGQIVGALAIAAYKTEHSPYMLGTVLSIGHAIETAMVLKSEHYRTLLLQQKLTETSNHLILITDRDGHILHRNRSAEDLVPARGASTLQDIFSEKSAPLVALLEQRDLTDFHEKLPNPRTGVECHLFWDARWVIDPLDHQSRLLLVGRDMTRYVQLERNMRHSERLSTMGMFSAQIAHEIRNPVAVIKLAMQLMLGQEEFSEKSEKKGKMILNEIRRIEDLVNHFLNISRPQTPNFENCEIVELLQGTCNLMQGVFREANLRLVEHYQEVGSIRADCDQVHQVILNLLGNAIDATPAGGRVELTVQRDAEEPEFVRIEVRDTGQGIPEDSLQDIFEPFYTTKSKGTGLGLHNAKSIIEAHGGDMEIASEVDRGTTFTIWLPVTQMTS
ncbi:ATP-binding protein [Tumebacillus permanentifrigoris]|uniref:histidine kinase n=1 Tax=Tumebacillus permanentifrigoris TaxID=378543 RepID=A0A316D5W0_9BACL|nr:ATP-binding protein [Tumebacillus permanentifrigoris]PWK07465.1 signal transduction histidine kinase [Tumebacillus permanentifrigoris]